jgi:hypothetical protein
MLVTVERQMVVPLRDERGTPRTPDAMIGVEFSFLK